MSIEKGIRAFSLKPVMPPENESTSEDGNSDLGYLDTSCRKGKIDPLLFLNKKHPESLTLRVKIVPVLREKVPVLVQISINNNPSDRAHFYSKNVLELKLQGHTDFSQHQAVELIYQGQGFFTDKGEQYLLSSAKFQLEVTEGDCVLRKNFLIQTQPILHQRQTYIDEGKWLITPPYGGSFINMYPIMAYGGFVKPGIPLERITQIFATPYRDHEASPVMLKMRSQKDLESWNIPPPQPGYLNNTFYCYIDRFRNSDLLSLAGHIETGKSRLHVVFMEEGEEQIVTYQSYRYTQGDSASNSVDLHFRPMDE